MKLRKVRWEERRVTLVVQWERWVVHLEYHQRQLPQGAAQEGQCAEVHREEAAELRQHAGDSTHVCASARSVVPDY